MSVIAGITGVSPAMAEPSRAKVWIVPRKGDPRIPFSCILTAYAVLGCTLLGFNRTPLQILLTVVAGCLLDTGLHWIFSRRELLVPLSAYISMMSIALLLNYSH